MIEHNPENRTPSAWSRNCLEILKGVNPNYRKNKEVKGKFIEFIRQDNSGLIISQNFIRIRDTYYLGFALLFTTKATTALDHPLLAGSRFDHNVTIWRQFERDLGLFRTNPKCPKGIWSFGPWRKNTMDLLLRGLSLPEEYLFPHYLGCLRKGKKRLINLFSRAHELLKDCPSIPDTTAERIASLVGVDYGLVFKYREESYALNALNIATAGKCWYGHGPPDNCFNVKKVPIDAIILNRLDVFLAEKARLNEINEIAENL